jgi:hypothetical protein
MTPEQHEQQRQMHLRKVRVGERKPRPAEPRDAGRRIARLIDEAEARLVVFGLDPETARIRAIGYVERSLNGDPTDLCPCCDGTGWRRVEASVTSEQSPPQPIPAPRPEETGDTHG